MSEADERDVVTLDDVRHRAELVGTQARQLGREISYAPATRVLTAIVVGVVIAVGVGYFMGSQRRHAGF